MTFNSILIILILFLFQFNSLIFLQNGWEVLNSPTNELLRNLTAVDENFVWAAGTNGTIIRTTNGGDNWNQVIVDSSEVSDYPVIRFKFFDNQLGFASGGHRDQAGVMWRTTDGGFNWSAAGISPDEIFDFYILDSLNVIALSGDPEWIYPTEIVLTTNAGLEWTSIETEHYALSFALDFRKPHEGWSASGYFFLLTTNAGESWDTVHTPAQTAILDLQFISDTIGFACGQDGALLKYVGSTVNVINDITPVSQFKLGQNYPNPFNPITIITWQTPVASYNVIKVYDLLGNEVATLVNEYRQAGYHEIALNADKLSSGVYFYTLSASGFFQSKKNDSYSLT